MAEESTVQIRLISTADTSGVASMTEAVKESTEVQGQQVDAQDEAKASFEKTMEALKDKVEADKDHSTALDDSTKKTRDLDDGMLKLPTGLRAAAGGLGATALAAGVMKAGFDAWLRQNPELQASLDNTTAQVGKLATGVMSEWFETWIMKAETGRGILNSLTIALGGETEAMKAASEPMQGYLTDKEEAAKRTRDFNTALDDEARAADDARTALDGELTVLKELNAIKAAARDLELDRKIREIDASDAKPEVKATQKAAARNANEKEGLTDRNTERATATMAAQEKARLAQIEAVQLKEEAADEAARARAQSLTAHLVALNKELRERLEIAEKWANGAGGAQEESKAEAELLKAMIADNERGMSPAVGSKEKADEIGKRAAEAEKAAAKAAKEAKQVAESNRRAGEEDGLKTTRKTETNSAQGAAEAAAAKKKQQEEEARAEAAVKRKQQEEERKKAADERRARQEREAAERQKGTDLAGQGSAAAAGLKGEGFNAAAGKLEAATKQFKDGSSEQELARAAQAMTDLATKIGGVSPEVKQELSKLWKAIETAQSQIKNAR